MRHNIYLPPSIRYAIPLIIFTFSSCQKKIEEIKPGSLIFADVSALIASGRTNIILIIGDDIGYEIPTYSGGESYSTPNLDFMAANGMQFPDFFSHPDGPPSRLALMTGKYNFRNWTDFGYLSPDSKTIGNMLHDANYKTCYVGKWQLDGGDTSIKNHGFDKYLVFLPFNPANNNNHDQSYRRYKNPYLYKNGNYLTDSQVEGKYSEDLFFDYASNFIDSNTTKPFFLIYSHTLAQHPWSPTPDNPDFASWNPSVNDENEQKKYFPDMVAYLDKIVGKIITKVQISGLSNKTVIIFTSDNATSIQLTSLFKGDTIRGGKTLTSMRGLKVPMVVYWPGTVLPGRIDTSLTDMTDILPTLANIAHIPIPTTWGSLDGQTFYDNLIGAAVKSKQRNYVYCFWPAYATHKWDRTFVYNYNYKLYDSTTGVSYGGDFYNIMADPNEKQPLKDHALTRSERQIKLKFKNILDSMHAQK